MNPQSAALAFNQHLKIAARLRCLYHAESVFLLRHLQVFCFIAGNLQEHAGIRAAFVSLTRAMKKARTEAKHRGNPLRFYDCFADLLQCCFVLREHRNISQEAEVIARFQPVQMLPDYGANTVAVLQKSFGVSFVREELESVAFENGFFRRKRTGFLELGCQVSRGNFTCFHIGLIKGINANYRTGNTGGNLPLKEDLAEIVQVIQHNPHHGLSRFFQSGNDAVGRFVIITGKPDIGEDAIIAVHFRILTVRREQRLTVHGNQSMPFLTGGLSQQLLQPCAQIMNGRRTD